MTKKGLTVGVIGAGKMGSALVRGLVEPKASSIIDARWIAAAEISVWDPDQAQVDRLVKDLGVRKAADNGSLAAASSLVIVAVKPDVVPAVLKEINPRVGKQHLIVSIAAGVTLHTLEGGLPRGTRVVRAMPNTPCLVAAGAIAFCRGQHATPEDAEQVLRLFKPLGVVVELQEKQIDAVTGLSASGPAFLFVVIEALADGGVRMGLPRQVAQLLAAQTMLGAARMVLETGRHPAELKDQVASPGGTTIAGLKALEQMGLRAALIEAVEAATRRATELGRNPSNLDPHPSPSPPAGERKG